MLGDYGNMVIVRDKTHDLPKLHDELESRLLSFRGRDGEDALQGWCLEVYFV